MINNKKLVIHFVLVIALGYVFMSLGLWWGVCPSAFLATLFISGVNMRQYILSGTGAGFLLWLIWSAWLSYDGGQQITERIADLFNISSPLLLVFGGILGALLGGFGALAGTIRIR